MLAFARRDGTVVRAEGQAAVLRVRIAAAAAVVGVDPSSGYQPHVSLLYGEYAQERLATLAEPLVKRAEAPLEYMPGRLAGTAAQYKAFVAPEEPTPAPKAPSSGAKAGPSARDLIAGIKANVSKLKKRKKAAAAGGGEAGATYLLEGESKLQKKKKTKFKRK